MDVSSYRPISVLPTISKVPEKPILKKINKDLKPQDWIPKHQFGFRQAHYTVQQCHLLTDVINEAMEDQQYCSAAFFDVSQTFENVWHPGLMGLIFKIKSILSLKQFRPADIVPKRTSIRNENQRREFKPLPLPFRYIPRLLSKNLKIKIYKIIILPVVLFGCEAWSLTLREERKLRVFEKWC